MFADNTPAEDLLPKLRMPVLIVWGAEDRIFPLHQAEKMHSLIPQSQLDVVADCGHLSPMECSNEIGPKAVEFIRQ
jgi:pimeloyl-ACP methyl ester carboxylesterase